MNFFDLGTKVTTSDKFRAQLEVYSLILLCLGLILFGHLLYLGFIRPIYRLSMWTFEGF